MFKNLNFNLIKEFLHNELVYHSTVNFENGLKEGWGGNFALLRPINHFTILISSNGGNFLEIAKKISKELGIIEYYITNRSSNLIGLSRFEFGNTTREFIVTGDSGIITNEGVPTAIELKIAEREQKEILENSGDNFNFYSGKEMLSFLGDEEHLMEIAENWSINPAKLDEVEVFNCVEIFKLKK